MTTGDVALLIICLVGLAVGIPALWAVIRGITGR